LEPFDEATFYVPSVVPGTEKGYIDFAFSTKFVETQNSKAVEVY
jgi:hypothetical protein